MSPVRQIPLRSAAEGIAIVETPAQFPAVCALTRSGTGPFLDLKRENPYGERIYVCAQAAMEIATAIEWAPKGEIAAAKNKVEELREALASSNARREQAVARYENLKTAVDYTLKQGTVVHRGPHPTEPHRRVDVHTLRQKPGLPKPRLD